MARNALTPEPRPYSDTVNDIPFIVSTQCLRFSAEVSASVFHILIDYTKRHLTLR